MALSSPAATRNKDPILNVLHPKIDLLRNRESGKVYILEVASGTGEHAAYFTSLIPNIVFQPTEPQQTMHESIASWAQDQSITNVGSQILPPKSLDVMKYEDEYSSLPDEFQNCNTDLLICINMIHISPFECTSALFKLAKFCVRSGGYVMTYGPYRVDGQMVESNIMFDASLRSRDSSWGVRDKEDVEAIAEECGFVLEDLFEMPANNLTLFFKKN